VVRNIDMKKKFIGAMLGSALGDAIGEIVLYKAARGLIENHDVRCSVSVTELIKLAAEFNQLKYTDDTAMAIGLAESLISRGRIDPQRLGDRFRINYDREPWRGYAGGPPAIFLMVEQRGLSYVEASQRVGEALYGAQGSYGNGAAMRITPLGLYFYDDPDLYSLVEASAKPTHTHPVAADGAAVLAKAIAIAVELLPQQAFDQQSFCRELIGFARTPEITEKMRLVLTLLLGGASPSEAADKLGRGVSTHESVPFAIYSFLREPISFMSCLLCAVTNGGDCDTLGAMACGISGAYLGVDAIPKNWAKKLENRAYIAQLACWLYEMKVGIDKESERKRAAIEKWDRESAKLNQELLEEL